MNASAKALVTTVTGLFRFYFYTFGKTGMEGCVFLLLHLLLHHCHNFAS